MQYSAVEYICEDVGTDLTYLISDTLQSFLEKSEVIPFYTSNMSNVNRLQDCHHSYKCSPSYCWSMDDSHVPSFHPVHVHLWILYARQSLKPFKRFVPRNVPSILARRKSISGFHEQKIWWLYVEDWIFWIPNVTVQLVLTCIQRYHPPNSSQWTMTPSIQSLQVYTLTDVN